jgi:uncharacterized protein (TIGR02270 family)
MVDLLVEHYEELEFLWAQRQSALHSPVLTLRELGDLEERIEAHLEGLLVGERHALQVVENGLAGSDESRALAAAFTLMRLNDPDAQRMVLGSFMEAHGQQLEGIRQALCHSPIEDLGRELEQAFTTAPEPVAAAAAEVLAFHGRLDPHSAKLVNFISSKDPEVRARAWHAQSCLASFPDRRLFAAAMEDNDALVRREALLAAAWARERWVLDYCRAAASQPSAGAFDALMLLAVLGQPEDLARVIPAASFRELGPPRYQLLGAFGHPKGVELLLTALETTDLRSSIAAGAAFTKITGHNIASSRRVQLPPADGHEPDAFEREFLDEATLPDPLEARAYWRDAAQGFSRGTRWCRGLDLSQTPGQDVLKRLDMESHYEARLRGRFEGTWSGSPADLERFLSLAGVPQASVARGSSGAWLPQGRSTR